MRWLGLLGLFAAAAFADSPRITFIKEFPGSVPAYTNITLERTGDTVYKEAVNDEYPLRFKLRAGEVDEIFQLADKLDRFSKPLESGLKVANMGMKTLRFENGAARSETKFNYSLDENARLILDWFEKMVESEQHFIRLERTVKFDKLGVNQALLLFQISYERRRIVAPEQFLPLLDRLVKNESYLHMARERAAALAENIRGQGQEKQAKVE